MRLWKGTLQSFEKKSMLDDVYPDNPYNPLFQFLVDPAIRITTKSFFANVVSVLFYIFFVLNMIAIPSKYCNPSLPSSFISFCSLIQNFIRFPLDLKIDIFKNPQLYVSLIITTCGLAYYVCLILYISKRFLTPTQQKIIFILDEILSIPVILYYPSSIFSGFISYWHNKANYIMFFAVVNLVIFPAYIISLIRRFVSISSFGLPYVVGCPRKSFKNILFLSLAMTIMNISGIEIMSPFILLSAAFISIYEGIYVYHSPYFITSYMGFFSLSHPFIVSWTCIVTTDFYFYTPTIVIYLGILLTGYTIIWIMCFIEIYRSKKKANRTVENNESIDVSKLSPKELFYILSNFSGEDIFSDTFLQDVVDAYPGDRYLIFHTMMVLINHPNHFPEVNSIARKMFVLNTGSVFHTISLSYIISISSNVIKKDAGQYLDKNTEKRMMEPVLAILRDIWRSIIQGDLYIAVNGTYSLTRYVSMYTSYLKLKQKSSDMLYTFIKYVSFDYSQLEEVSEEDQPKKELSKISNQFSMSNQSIVVGIFYTGVAINVFLMVWIIALTIYSLVNIYMRKALLYDACTAIEAIFIATRTSCDSSVSGDIAGEIINMQSEVVLRTKFFTKYVNTAKFNLFITSCYQLAFEDLTFFIESDIGRKILNQTTSNMLGMVNDMTTAVNKFLKDISGVNSHMKKIARLFFHAQTIIFVVFVLLQSIAIWIYRKIIYRSTSQVFYYPMDEAIRIYNEINSRVDNSFSMGIHLSTISKISISIFGTFVFSMSVSTLCMFVERANINSLTKIVCSGMAYHSIFPHISSMFLLIPMLSVEKDPYIINASTDAIVILHQITVMTEELHNCSDPYTGTLVLPDTVKLFDSPLYPLNDNNRTFRFLENVEQVIYNLNIALKMCGHNNTRATTRSLTRLLELTKPMAGIKTSIDETEDFETMKLYLAAIIFLLLCFIIHMCLLISEGNTIRNMQEVIRMEARFVAIGDHERGLVNGKPNMNRDPLVPPDIQAVDDIPCALVFFRNGKVESQNETARKFYGELKSQTKNNFRATIENSDHNIITKMHYKGGAFPNSTDPFVVIHDIKRITLIKEQHSKISKEFSRMVKDEPTISGYSIFNDCVIVHIIYRYTKGVGEALEMISYLLQNSNIVLTISFTPGEIVLIFYGHSNTKAVVAANAIENGFSAIKIFKNEGISAKCAVYISQQCVILGKSVNDGSMYIFSSENWVGSVLLHQADYGEVAITKDATKFVIGHKVLKRVQYKEKKYQCDCYVYEE